MSSSRYASASPSSSSSPHHPHDTFSNRQRISYNSLIELPPVDVASSSLATPRSSALSPPGSGSVVVGKKTSSSSSLPASSLSPLSSSSSSSTLLPSSAASSAVASHFSSSPSSSSRHLVGKPHAQSSSTSTALSFTSSDDGEGDLDAFFPSTGQLYPPPSAHPSASSSSFPRLSFLSKLLRSSSTFASRCCPPQGSTRARCQSLLSFLRATKEYLVKNVFFPPASVLLSSDRETSRLIFFTFLYAFLHGATDQLLPAAYKTLELQLHFSPTVLGTASSLSRLAHAISCPLWGLTVDAVSNGGRSKNNKEPRRRARLPGNFSTTDRKSLNRERAPRYGREDKADEEEEESVSLSTVAEVEEEEEEEEKNMSYVKKKKNKKASGGGEEGEDESMRERDSPGENGQEVLYKNADEVEDMEGERGEREGRRGEIGILQLSCWGWGVCTLLLACIHREWQLMPLMLCSGFLMAVMGPVTQKILGEAVQSDRRGSAFGSMSFFQSLGRMTALLFTTSLSGRMLFNLVAGWRFAFGVMGVLSVFFSVSLTQVFPNSARLFSSFFSSIKGLFFSSSSSSSRHQRLSSSSSSFPGEGEDEEGRGRNRQRERERREGEEEGRSLSWRERLQGFLLTLFSLAYVFKTRSFMVMLLLGVLNGMPRSALNFIVMFFQYAGLSDWEASFTVSASWLAAMLVAPFVGCLGDAVHRRYPNKGRPVIAQSAILVRSLLMFSILYCVPKKRESFLLFLLLSSLIGLMAGWPGVGVNRPILTEIVLPKHRATVFSLFSTMEGIGSALLGSPVVGMLAQKVFGYTQPLKRSAHLQHSSSSSPAPSSSSLAQREALLESTNSTTLGPELKKNLETSLSPRNTDQSNAEALSLALICTTVGPWILSVGVYFLLHCTYTADRQAAALAASKLQEEEEKERETIEVGGVASLDLESQRQEHRQGVMQEEEREKTRLERKQKKLGDS